MAINKNFVIKNGVEVNTSLIVGDADLNKVGVGTTVPGYTLHVGGSRGGIGATDLTVTGIATVGTSGSTSAALSVVGVSSFQGDIHLLGSAGVSTISFDASLDKLNFADNARATFGADDDLQIFHDGSKSIIRETGTGNLVIEGTGETLASFIDDGAVELYYNNTKRLETTGFGVTIFDTLHSKQVNVSGASTFTGIATFNGANVYVDNDLFVGGVNINGGSGGALGIDLRTRNINASGIATITGQLGIGSIAAGAGLTVFGDVDITGLTTTNTLQVGNLGLSVTGVSTFSDDLAVGVSTLFADVSTGRIGIGTAVPETTLDVAGSLTANSARIEDLTNNRVVIAGADGELEDSSNLTFDGAKFNVGSGVTIQPHGGVSIAGIVTVGGDLNVVGDITYDEIGGRNINITGFSTFGDDLNVGLTTFFVDVSNGGVGVGTDNPNPNGYGPQFKVFGNNPVLALEDDGGGVNAFGFVRQNSNTLQIVTGDNSDNKIQISKTSDTSSSWTGSNLTNIVTIDQGSIGVGIATASLRDSAKLDVDGGGRFSGSVIVKDGGNAGAGVTIFDNGNIAASGIITASTFVGSFSGTVTTATNVTVADESSDTTCFPLFVTAATGDLAPKSGTNLSFNSSSGRLDATQFNGNFVGGTVSGTTGTFSSDVDIADKIVHTGDTNTAIRFPAADTFTVETGGSERVRVDSSGRLLVGSDTTITDDNFGIGNLQVTDTTGFQHVLFSGHSAAAANATALSLGRSRGSQSSPGYLSSGDHIARFSAISYNGGNYGSSGCIDFYAGDQHASDDLPGYIALKTVPDGSATLTERLRVTSAGLVGIATATPRDSSTLDVDGGGRFNGDVSFSGSTGAGSTVLFDQSDNSLKFVDNAKAKFGSSSDLEIYHDGSKSLITDSGTGWIEINTNNLRVQNAAANETIIYATENGSVELYHNNSKKLETTADGVDFDGTGSIKVPVGTTAERPTGVAGDFRYNSTTGSFEGYTDEWGAIAGGGGASETDTAVSSTSATSIYTTAHATNRSVSAIIQITQGSSYQVGRYLVIHDGTTATIIEESAVATGDMLGTFTADINGSNLRILVNMSSASSATVTILPTVVTV